MTFEETWAKMRYALVRVLAFYQNAVNILVVPIERLSFESDEAPEPWRGYEVPPESRYEQFDPTQPTVVIGIPHESFHDVALSARIEAFLAQRKEVPIVTAEQDAMLRVRAREAFKAYPNVLGLQLALLPPSTEPFTVVELQPGVVALSVPEEWIAQPSLNEYFRALLDEEHARSLQPQPSN